MGAVWAALLALQQGPAVAGVSARSEPTKVAVVFDRPVDRATAETAANYAIEPAVKVESAVRSLDLRSVTLTTAPLSPGVDYVLTVRSVRDCSEPPLAMSEPARRPFTFAKGLFSAPKASAPAARRIPKFDAPLLFNTPEADAVLSAMQVFPRNHPWNEDVSKRPVHPDSDALVDSIGRNETLAYNWDMAFVLVPPNQPRVDVKLVQYGGESDKGPFPVPDNAPVEGWPVDGRTLEQSQTGGGSDRHVLVVDPHGGMLYEFFVGYKRPAGWEAAGAAAFNLRSLEMRPRGWTSSDAAGLPIFPSLPRFDECERGEVTHALRFTVSRTRREFIWPARHHAGSTDSPAVPAMGQRFRLKASVDLTGFSKHARAIALALKKHGMLVADNGGDWQISVPPDRRLTGLESLRKLKGGDFEVVVTTGEKELGR
jgi:hypothetical protein